MEEFLALWPKELLDFVLTALFSLLIGLSQLKMQLKHDGSKEDSTSFGTDRTFTFIGILGYILYLLDSVHYLLFIGGGLALVIFLALSYWGKIKKHDSFGMTSIIIALITYSLAPILITQPLWFSLTIVVFVLMLTEMKPAFMQLANKMRNDELIILAKFLTISGIILPMLPVNVLIEGTNLTPYSIWLTTVVVSSISYASYLLKRYVFKDSGVIVSGVLGGLYSSTATITLLAKESRTVSETELPKYAAAMVISLTMMFLRFLVLTFIFNQIVFHQILPFLLSLAVFSAFISWLIYRKSKNNTKTSEIEHTEEDYKNPLEFKVALIFAGLFVLFTVVTNYTVQYLGNSGLTALAGMSGLSDITPFVLNILQNTANLENNIVVMAILLSMLSNNFVTMLYGFFFSGRNMKLRKMIFPGFLSVVGLSILFLIGLWIFV